MSKGFVAAGSLVMLACTLLYAEPPRPAKPAEYLIGEMHVQNLPAMTYIYGEQQTTFATIQEPIGKILTPLLKAADEGKLQKGPILFIYTGVQEDISKPFTLQIGTQVADNTKLEGFKVRKTEAFRCATILYTGALSNMSKVYEKLMPAALAAGYKPTGEARELYLYFENPESPNNVVQIQLGIQQ